MTNLPKYLKHDYRALEQAFKEAVGNLPNYKRRDAFDFINALRDRIEYLEGEVEGLAKHISEKEKKSESEFEQTYDKERNPQC